MVSQSWKNLSDDERMPWLEMGRRDRERYEREKAAYKGPWKIPDVKDPSAPKKPMSAFLAFSNERRKIVAEANPSMTGVEISTLMSKLWKDCPEHMKQAYRNQEARERQLFKRDRAEWERKREALFLDQSNASCDDFAEQQSTVPTMLYTPNIQTSTTQNIANTSATTSNTALQMTLLSPKYDGATMPCPSFFLGNAVASSHHRTVSQEPAAQEQFIPEEAWPFNPVPHTISLPTPSESSSRFENYSIDDILQDDELFEDFSPMEIKTTVGCSSNNNNNDSCNQALMENFESYNGFFS